MHGLHKLGNFNDEQLKLILEVYEIESYFFMFNMMFNMMLHIRFLYIISSKKLYNILT